MLTEKILHYGRALYHLLGERRSNQRVAFTCTVAVSCLNRYGQLTANLCTCRNLSDRGIGFVSLEPIPVNSDVYIHSDAHKLRWFGRVRYCLAKGDNNYIGCTFRPAPEYWHKAR